MTRALRCICLGWLLAAGAALPASAQSASPDLIWGVNGHPLASYPGVTTEQQLDYIKALGMTSYRVDVAGLDQASALARLVRTAKARGIDILPVITPRLNLDKATAADLYAAARRLAVGLIGPLKDDVRVWELGNELENYAIIKACEMRDDGVQYNCAWGPAGGVSPLEYYGPRWAKVSAVLKGLSDGAIAVDPAIRKAIGTAGWGHIGVFERLAQDGIAWDISVWHMYGQDPEWALKTLARFKKPIWVTEFNNPAGSRDGAREQADGLVRAMVRLRQLRSAYRIEAAHVYELMDETYWAPSFEAHMGLVGLVKGGPGGWTPGAPKPAFAAVQRLIALPADMPGVAPGCHLSPHQRLSAPASMLVSYAYCLVLGRMVDEAGAKRWTAALEGGAKVGQMLLELIESAEFRSSYATSGLGDAAYVDLLYRRLVQRDADDAGRADYVAAMRSGKIDRAGLAAALIGSEEFRNRHPLLFTAVGSTKPAAEAKQTQAPRRTCDLTRYDAADTAPRNTVAYGFCLVLGRAPDAIGLEDWSASLGHGTSRSQMVLAMLASDEFRGKHTPEKLGNAEFVALMFRILLGREPDGSGLADYASKLDSGALARSALPKAIIASGEFAAKHPLLARRDP